MRNGHFKGCNPDVCRCESRRYWIIFGIGCGIFVAEIVGGILSGSLALLSDAFHILVDSLANIVSILVVCLVPKRWISESKCRAWGGYINAAFLLVIAVWIFHEAVARFLNPPKITSWIMISVAVLGLVGNLIQNHFLRVVTEDEERHVTHEAMHLHVISDLWQTITVILGGIIIALTGKAIVDPVLSVIISVVMAVWGIRLFRQSRREHKKIPH